ncbi:MAG: pyroglutamyl-peptidase I [Hyphomicrobiaceae bacterium]
MPQDRPAVLITGFGPFPTVAANATSVLVPRIAEACRRAVPGVAFSAFILPTEWQASLALLDELTVRLRPVVSLHFGVSGRATGFEIETRGRNVCSQSEDAAGKLPDAACVSPGGPEFLPATLPAAHIVERLRRRGLPAQVSRDAGGYLCNALLYRSLEIARAFGAPARSGFVHLPASLVNERRPALEPRSGMALSWDDVVEGSVEIAAAALGRTAAGIATSRLTPGVNRRSTMANAVFADFSLRPADTI